MNQSEQFEKIMTQCAVCKGYGLKPKLSSVEQRWVRCDCCDAFYQLTRGPGTTNVDERDARPTYVSADPKVRKDFL